MAGEGGGEGAGGAGVEVGLGFPGGGGGDGAADADLAGEGGPVEAEGRVRAGREVAALCAVVVRGEGPAVLVGAVQHDRAYVRQALLVRGRQRHGVRLRLACRHRLREPGGEERERGGGCGGRVEGAEFGDSRLPDAGRPQQTYKLGVHASDSPARRLCPAR